MQTSRRNFLRGSVYASTALTLGSTWSRALGANGDARIAIIGCNGKGKSHMQDLVKKMKEGKGGFRLVAMCDADQAVLDARKADLAKEQVPAEFYQDYRKLLDNKDIDAVIIATPNHLHTLIGVTALEAGKDVYVEKPVSHNIWEGRQLANFSKKHEGTRVCFHGMQRRSDHGWAEIMDWVGQGKLGKATLSRGLCYKLRPTIGKTKGPQQPPATVDYSLWCGPREMKPLMREKLHYDWHWQWEQGNGDIGNQGPHQLDIARLLIGDPQQSPENVLSIGGRFGYDDDATTANTQIAFFDFKPIPVIFEVRGLPYEQLNFKGRGNKWLRSGVDVGNILHLEGGYIVEGQIFANGNDAKPIERIKLNDGANHMNDFLKALHDRKVDPNHSATTGHLSASLAHLANISYRVGKEQPAESIKESLKNAAFAQTYTELLAHLERNGVKDMKPVLGAALTFDPKAEQFTGDMAEAANKYVKEDYRAEFSLPAVGKA